MLPVDSWPIKTKNGQKRGFSVLSAFTLLMDLRVKKTENAQPARFLFIKNFFQKLFHTKTQKNAYYCGAIFARFPGL
jgi:hypothetical protein